MLSATLLAGAPAARADDGTLDNTGQAPLPSGQFITPAFATGSTFTTLNPDLPEYTAAIGNYPFFHPNGAIASTLSPDGETLAVMTAGYNVLDDADAKLVPTGWYPTTVTISADGGTMYVFNSKSDPGGNPNKVTSSVQSLTNFTYPGGNTGPLRYKANQYVFQLEQSGMLMAPVPAAADLANLTAQVAANNGWSIASNAEDDKTMSFLRQRIKQTTTA